MKIIGNQFRAAFKSKTGQIFKSDRDGGVVIIGDPIPNVFGMFDHEYSVTDFEGNIFDNAFWTVDLDVVSAALDKKNWTSGFNVDFSKVSQVFIDADGSKVFWCGSSFGHKAREYTSSTRQDQDR